MASHRHASQPRAGSWIHLSFLCGVHTPRVLTGSTARRYESIAPHCNYLCGNAPSLSHPDQGILDRLEIRGTNCYVATSHDTGTNDPPQGLTINCVARGNNSETHIKPFL